MLAVLFNSRLVRDSFDVHFLHRANPAYESGFKAAVLEPPAVTAIRLPDTTQLRFDLGKLPRPLAFLFITLVRIFFLKYIFVIIDYFRIKAKVRELQPDLMFVNNGGHPGAYSAIAAVLAGRSAGVGSIVYFVNNTALGYTNIGRLPDYFLDRKLARSADIFASGSRFCAQRLQAVLGLPAEKVHNLYNGIPVCPPNLTAEAVRQNFNIPAGRRVILSGGFLVRRKGHLFLLQAMKNLKNSMPAISLPFCLLAGTGDLESELASFIKKNDLSGDISLAGFDPNFYNLVNACDIFVHPSIGGEDLPNVISMAMACSKPVIGTKIAGIPEQIQDGGTGYLVEPGDSDALAEKIALLAGDPQAASSMGRAAYARFESMFTAEVAVESYTNLFNFLLAGKC